MSYNEIIFFKNLVGEKIERSLLLFDDELEDVRSAISTEFSTWNKDDYISLHNVVYGVDRPFRDTVTREEGVLTENLGLINGPNIDIVIFLPTTSSLLLSANLPSVANAINAVRERGLEVVLGIIKDGIDEGEDFNTKEIGETLFNVPYFLILHQLRRGYLRGIESGLVYFQKEKGLSARYAGFVDDDAHIISPYHYLTLLGLLQEGEYSAVSGFACDNDTGETLHDFFNLPTSFRLLYQIPEGMSISRLHIHGGGGACLMDFETFREGLKSALENGTLLGPTISAISLFGGKKTIAYDGSPVLHPTKSSFIEWLKMVIKYYRSWIKLFHIYGENLTQFHRRYSLELEDVYREIMEPKDFLRFSALKRFRSSFKELLPKELLTS